MPTVGVPPRLTESSFGAHFENRAVGSTPYSNPFDTPQHSPTVSISSNNVKMASPVSPVEDSSGPTTRRTHIASQYGLTSNERKSVDLKKLDGKPYPMSEEKEPKLRQVKVAQDMYAGEQPPGYQTADGAAIFPKDQKSEKATPHSHNGMPCHKCGHNEQLSGERPHTHGSDSDCKKCGKIKTRAPPSAYPTAQMAGVIPSRPQASSAAGPSTRPPHKHCDKCGKRKKTGPAATAAPSHSYTRSVPVIQTNGFPIGINVEPPTAGGSSRPSSSRWNQPEQTRPSSRPGPPPADKPRRGNSISSLFRSLSRRNRKSMDAGPLPSQQLPAGEQQSRGQIANMISNAMQSDKDYHRLSVGERIERPDSPFSFVDKPKEEEAFELNDIRKSKLLDHRNSWDNADEARLSVVEKPAYSRSQSERVAHQSPAVPPVPQDDTYLGIAPDQRPGVTRFKSLRSGVNRAASQLGRSASQVGRSTSLRRLGSVKNVPQFWYRDDMAIEGANYNQGYAY